MTERKLRLWAMLFEIALCVVLGLAAAWAVVTRGPSLGLALLIVLITGRLMALARPPSGPGGHVPRGR
jgi:hypothetical protein